MRRLALMLALASLLLAACGGGDSGGEREPAPPARGTPGTSSANTTEPSRAEIEEFGRITLPESARDVEARMSSALDTGMFLRFVMDRQDVDAFVRSGNFDAKPNYKPTYAYNEVGWHLDQVSNAVGVEEFDGNFGRELVIDLDQPDVATVYLVASTV
jgi:hypothetical protein